MTCSNCPRLARRRFIAIGSAGIVTAGLTTGCSQNAVDTLSEDVEITLADYPRLANVDETVFIDFDAVALPIAVTRTGVDNEFVVTGTECNHQGCQVGRSGDGFQCPCHGAAFALDGSLRRGPATKGLTNYDYEVDDATGIMTIFAN
jgi:nitrite reductase/ring-hydroxylating ferredoxin subunit